MKAVHFIEKVSPKLYACRWVTINFCSSLRFTTFRRICYRWRNTRQRLFQTKNWKRIRVNIIPQYERVNDENYRLYQNSKHLRGNFTMTWICSSAGESGKYFEIFFVARSSTWSWSERLLKRSS